MQWICSSRPGVRPLTSNWRCHQYLYNIFYNVPRHAPDWPLLSQTWASMETPQTCASPSFVRCGGLSMSAGFGSHHLQLWPFRNRQEHTCISGIQMFQDSSAMPFIISTSSILFLFIFSSFECQAKCLFHLLPPLSLQVHAWHHGLWSNNWLNS